MAKKHGLDVISNRTRNLWYKVNEKYGCHVYTLAVNGNDRVCLCKSYMEDIAVGAKNVNAKLKELLEA